MNFTKNCKILQYQNSWKINNNLTKFQRNFQNIPKQESEQSKTPKSTNNWLKIQTASAKTRQLVKRQQQQQKTPCQSLWQTKTTTPHLLENNNKLYRQLYHFIKNTHNMVATEETTVKYLEIPDKSENDKKHYK